MNKKKIILNIILSAAVITSTIAAVPQKTFAATARYGGTDRYDTSVEVAKGGWTSSGSDTVILASGEGYADALCAAPLAKKYSAPILLTESQTLNDKVKSEISSLGAKNVIIIGGTASISDSIENELESEGLTVKRIWGQDRYETSVAAAKELGSYSNIVLTSGAGYADALSIAPIAASQGMPILLTSKNTVPDTVKNYIDEEKSNITNTYLVGGTGVISDSSVASLPSSPIRISGNDRYETNVGVMSYFKSDIDFTDMYVVKGAGPIGNEYADALSASALAAKTSSPVILTNVVLPDCTEDFIEKNVSDNKDVIAVGGESAVPDDLLDYVNVISKIDKLKSISSKLKNIAQDISKDDEKNVLTNITSIIDKAISSKDLGDDFENDMDNSVELLQKLSSDEQADLYSKISSDSELMQLLQDINSNYGK